MKTVRSDFKKLEVVLLNFVRKNNQTSRSNLLGEFLSSLFHYLLLFLTDILETLRSLLYKVTLCSCAFQEPVASYEKFAPVSFFVCTCPIGVLEKFHLISIGKNFVLPEITTVDLAMKWKRGSLNV